MQNRCFVNKFACSMVFSGSRTHLPNAYRRMHARETTCGFLPEKKLSPLPDYALGKLSSPFVHKRLRRASIQSKRMFAAASPAMNAPSNRYR